jgi:hypothetical protein
MALVKSQQPIRWHYIPAENSTFDPQVIDAQYPVFREGRPTVENQFEN